MKAVTGQLISAANESIVSCPKSSEARQTAVGFPLNGTEVNVSMKAKANLINRKTG